MGAAGAPDRKVLDAGCGAAYGSQLLAEGGSREVGGVGIADAVLEAISPTMPDTVDLEARDLPRLDLADDGFDLVVRFEVIEHFNDFFVVPDELVRVLAPDRPLLVSPSTCDIHRSGDFHHRHEFRSAELKAALTSRLNDARLIRQNDYVASALPSDEAYKHGNGDPVPNLEVHNLNLGKA